MKPLVNSGLKNNAEFSLIQNKREEKGGNWIKNIFKNTMEKLELMGKSLFHKKNLLKSMN